MCQQFMKTLTGIIFLAIALLFQACSFTRAMLYWSPNITDHKIFQHTEMLPGDNIFGFKQGILNDNTTNAIDSLVKATTTTAFIIIRNDSVLFEKYYRGYKRDSISKNFSISKSITSLLTGIAVDEGYIESVQDPVTKYIPELKKKNPKFEQLTIEHLLNMRAGFKFNEDNYFPLSKATRLYYGTNHLGKIKRAKFKYEPGEVHEYQSLTTALLGVVVEKAIGKNLSEYAQEKIWIPLGMENRATWDIDDKRHHSNRAHVGVNATAIDLAKIGRLYLNHGIWNGEQIVSADWVAKSTTPDINYLGYQYHWWSYEDRIAKTPPVIKGDQYLFSLESLFPDSISARQYAKEKYPESKFVEPVSIKYKKSKLWYLGISPNEDCQFAAEGILHQWIFVDPKKDIIIVRLGEKLDTPSTFIRHLISRL